SFVALGEAAPDLPKTLKGILELPNGLERARAAAATKKGLKGLAGIAFDPVLPDPQAIWCLALNYKLHINETGLTTSSKYQQIFFRMPCTQAGPLHPVLCP